MTLRLNGSTSGYTEIDAPAVAGSNTLVLPTGNGSANQVLTTNGSGVLSWGAGSKILQVVQTVLTSTVSVSGSTWNEITSLATSITPSSTSSKILIMPSIDYSASSGYRTGFKIARGSTDILLGDNAGSRIRASQMGRFFDASDQLTNQANRIYLDSPSTTSSTTYKFYIAAENSTGAVLYVNRTVADSDLTSHFRGASTITLMEVAA